MTQWSEKSKFCQVIFLALALTLGAFGQEVEVEVYDYETTEEPVSTTSARPRVNRTMEEMATELDESRAARDTLNQTLTRMGRNMRAILNSVKSPTRDPKAIPGDNNNNNNSIVKNEGGIPGRPTAQVNAVLIQKLEKEIATLKNHTVVEPVALNTAPVGIPALQTEIRELGNRIESINSSLRHQNEANAKILLGNLSNLTDSVKDMMEVEKQRKRQQIVQDLLQAFRNNRNDQVKSLLDDLAKLRVLATAMPEIISGMFNGAVDNYEKIIGVLQSARPGQRKLGLTAVMDLFYNSSDPSKPGNFSATPQSLVDEPQYLDLAYLVKNEFKTQFLANFPPLVQNLVWKPKTCIKNPLANLFLVTNREGGLKDGGYPVHTKKRPINNPPGFCDWEFLSFNDRTVFNIRQRDSTAEGPLINLNVLQGSVAVGNSVRNQNYMWKVQLRAKAQEVTLQSIPTSSELPSYFLCSAPGSSRTLRQVELKSNGTGKACSWLIEG